MHKGCGSCGEVKPVDDFYSRGGKREKEKTNHCKVCQINRIKRSQVGFKRLCIKYKGGKCIRCGYSKCQGALVFHHRDPSEKDYKICGKSLCKLDDVAKAELDKCDLLCSNCHAEVHAGL